MESNKPNTDVYGDKISEGGYKAYGSYEFYKKSILERLFTLHQAMQKYDHLFFNSEWAEAYDPNHKNSKLWKKENYSNEIPELNPEKKYEISWSYSATQIMLSALRYLQANIRLLKPKIYKLDKDEQEKYNELIEYLNLIPEKIIINRQHSLKVYELFVNLVEELGYSDMNMKIEEDYGGTY